ncbi:MAG: PHP-associated domain-containing protein, partial [Vicinamibacteria bacterium]
LHLGVMGISEAQHDAVAARRTDPARLMAYLDQERIPWCVNHLFSPLTGPRTMDDFSFALERAHALETKNSMMPKRTNDFAAQVAESRGLGTVGGSDAHAVASVARAYTEVAGARSVSEFLEGVRGGQATAAGHSGRTALLTRDVVVNFARGYIEGFRNAHRSVGHALRALGLVGIAPVIPLIPILTTLIFQKEIRGGERLFAEFIDAGLGELEPRPSSLGASLAEPAA